MILPRLGRIAAAVSTSAVRPPPPPLAAPPLPAPPFPDPAVAATATTAMMARPGDAALAAAALAALTSLLCYAAYGEGLRRGGRPSGGRRRGGTGAMKAPEAAGDAARPFDAIDAPGPPPPPGPPLPAPPAPLPALPVRPIGTLRSVYRLCVGTPRQGMLAPRSRGVVTFDEAVVSRDAVLGLEGYSHVYVLFAFHLNSNPGAAGRSFGGPGGTRRQFPSKVAPPSLGGKKVGVFGTRTPHRPNPVGFSLCRLDGVAVEPRRKRGERKRGGPTFSLLLSGLDVVDGTPVLDVKPYVPHYDAVGHDPAAAPDGVRVPRWVDDGLRKRRSVAFLPAAEEFLGSLPDGALRFYGPGSPWRDRREDLPDVAKGCIREVLGADVRSAWQTRKARGGRSQAERSGRLEGWTGGGDEGGAGGRPPAVEGLCSQQIDNMLVQYTIEEPGAGAGEGTRVDERSRGSGAEDRVVVHSISLIRNYIKENPTSPAR